MSLPAQVKCRLVATVRGLGSLAIIWVIQEGTREMRKYWNVLARHGLAASLLALAVAHSHAAPVTVPATFSGPAQTFGASLSLTGTLGGQGGGTFGPAGPSQLLLDVPQQSEPIVLNPLGAISRNPTATANLKFDDVSLANQLVSDLNIDFFNGTNLPFSFKRIELEGTATTPSNPTPNPLIIRSDITGTIDSLSFVQDPGLSENGMFTGQLQGSLTANLGLALRVGILTIPINLDPIVLDFDEPFSLPGNFTLTDLQIGQAFPHDALAKIGNTLTNLSFSIMEADTFDLESTTTPLYDISGSFELAVTVGLNNALYSLETTLPDVINEEGAPTLVGDANGDCSVGAADYAIWAAQFGQTAAGLSADFDGNGSVGAGDYALWAANFGKTCPPAGAAVPEPSTLVLGLGGLLGLIGLIRRKRS